jgi:hypothetical protein
VPSTTTNARSIKLNSTPRARKNDVNVVPSCGDPVRGGPGGSVLDEAEG